MFGVDGSGFVWRNPAYGIDIINDPAGYTLSGPAVNSATFVGVIEGQSLAGDHIQGLYQPVRDVRMVNVLGGKQVYVHREPMMGTSFYPASHNAWGEIYGSLWGKLGDLLIDEGLTVSGVPITRILWCNVSFGGATAADLAPSGVLGHRMPLAFKTLGLLGIAPSRVNAVLAMQGESDHATATATYKTLRFATVQSARNLGFTGKYFIPQETYSTGSVSATLAAAQSEMVGTNGVVAGPSFDDLGDAYRYGTLGARTHLNATGRDTVAARWSSTIRAAYA